MCSWIRLKFITMVLLSSFPVHADSGSSGTTGGGDSRIPLTAFLPDEVEIAASYRWPKEFLKPVRLYPDHSIFGISLSRYAQELSLRVRYGKVEARPGESSYVIKGVWGWARENRDGSGDVVPVSVRRFDVESARAIVEKYRLRPEALFELLELVRTSKSDTDPEGTWFTIDGYGPVRFSLSRSGALGISRPLSRSLPFAEEDLFDGPGKELENGHLGSWFRVNGARLTRDQFVRRFQRVMNDVRVATKGRRLHEPAVQSELGMVVRGLEVVGFNSYLELGYSPTGLADLGIRLEEEAVAYANEILTTYISAIQTEDECDLERVDEGDRKKARWRYRESGSLNDAFARAGLGFYFYGGSIGWGPSVDHEKLIQSLDRIRTQVLQFCETGKSPEEKARILSEMKKENARALRLGDYLLEQEETR